MKKMPFLCSRLLAMLLTFGCLPSWALELGDIEVHSHLGEPLRATVQLPLSDALAPDALGAGCFKLYYATHDYPPITLNASIFLHENSGGNARLTFTSYRPLSDPSIRLTLTADCEHHASRTYVLQLDPPQLRAPQPGDSPSTAMQPPATSTNAIVAPLEQPEINAHSARKTAGASAHAQRQSAADTDMPTTDNARNVAEGQPRLVIGSTRAVYSQLKQSTQKWLAILDQYLLEAAIAADEITAMNTKLTQLETQVSALEQQYKTGLMLQPTAALIPKLPAEGWQRWLVYGLPVAPALILIGVVSWLKRRQRQQQLETINTIWAELPPLTIFDPEGDINIAVPITPEDENKAAAAPAAGRKKAASPPAPENHSDDSSPGATIHEGILEQAEVFVAHGRTKLAIALLQDHLREFPDLSPAPWIMMLDLLKRDQLVPLYEIAAEECRLHLNIAIPPCDTPPEDDHSSLEDIPRVRQQLEQVWGTTAAAPYLDDLAFNRRPKARHGFERNAYLEILLLRSIAHERGFTAPPGADTAVAAMQEKRLETDLAIATLTAGLNAMLSPASTRSKTERATDENGTQPRAADQRPALDFNFGLDEPRD